jgi:hypothetical protein
MSDPLEIMAKAYKEEYARWAIRTADDKLVIVRKDGDACDIIDDASDRDEKFYRRRETEAMRAALRALAKWKMSDELALVGWWKCDEGTKSREEGIKAAFRLILRHIAEQGK